MGQGRQRAKQAKIARELKYTTSETNLDALKEELDKAQQAKKNPSKVEHYDEEPST